MRRTIHAAGVALAISAGTAFAADIQRPGYYAPPPAAVAPVAYNWVGPYVGVNLGYHGATCPAPTEPPACSAASQAATIGRAASRIRRRGRHPNHRQRTTRLLRSSLQRVVGLIAGPRRPGLDSFLFYATAGLAFGEVEGQVGGLTESKTQLGWTAGLGTEVALNQRWSAKAEYLYVDLGDRNSRSPAAATASRPTCFALA